MPHEETLALKRIYLHTVGETNVHTLIAHECLGALRPGRAIDAWSFASVRSAAICAGLGWRLINVKLRVRPHKPEIWASLATDTLTSAVSSSHHCPGVPVGAQILSVDAISRLWRKCTLDTACAPSARTEGANVPHPGQEVRLVEPTAQLQVGASLPDNGSYHGLLPRICATNAVTSPITEFCLVKTITHGGKSLESLIVSWTLCHYSGDGHDTAWRRKRTSSSLRVQLECSNQHFTKRNAASTRSKQRRPRWPVT